MLSPCMSIRSAYRLFLIHKYACGYIPACAAYVGVVLCYLHIYGSLSLQASDRHTCSVVPAKQAKVREPSQEAVSSQQPQQPAAYQTSVHGPAGSGQTVHAQPPLAPQPSTSQQSSHIPLVRTTFQLFVIVKLRWFLQSASVCWTGAVCVCIVIVCSTGSVVSGFKCCVRCHSRVAFAATCCGSSGLRSLCITP